MEAGTLSRQSTKCFRSRRCQVLFIFIFIASLSLIIYAIVKYNANEEISINRHNFGPKYLPTKGQVWPKPKQQRFENEFYNFEIEHFQFHVTNQSCKILTDAIKRYFEIQDVEPTTRDHLIKSEMGQLVYLEVNVKEPCHDYDYPHFGMDESYNLTVESTVKLYSSSVWGAIRGLETLFQLFYMTDELELRINKTVINDAPRYLHRGLLIDTSRHYISLNNILTTIDAMAMNKMNVLHWHIVDDQSFPYQSEKFPKLSRLGAYHKSLIYTKNDIKTIVDYGRDRGIRVIPEFDVPGHTRSWGEAHPEVLSGCYQSGKFIHFGPMNPILNETYELLRELFAEIQNWFPDKYFHIGGDEVNSDCWTSDPFIKKYMDDLGIRSVGELHALFMNKAIPLLKRNTIPIVWQEVFDEKVPLSKNTLIQVWKYEWIQEMKNILRAGHKVLFSSLWYLDIIRSDIDWDQFYKADPRKMVEAYFAGSDSKELDNIVGGEACMWGEAVDDANIISRVWPRASAVAEKLWSPASPTDEVPVEVYHRLEEHTCRMKRRGVNAQPPNGPGFCV